MSCKHINKQQEEQLGNDVGKVFVQLNKFSENKHLDNNELPGDPNALPMINTCVHIPPLWRRRSYVVVHMYTVQARGCVHSRSCTQSGVRLHEVGCRWGAHRFTVSSLPLREWRRQVHTPQAAHSRIQYSYHPEQWFRSGWANVFFLSAIGPRSNYQ